MSRIAKFPAIVLPGGVRSRLVENVNGLTMHVLEAGFEPPARPRLLLLHGFPELAYSWRKLMGPLAQAGYHVIAPDQRGYGRTTGWSADYGGSLAPFRLLNLVRDAEALISALGHGSVTAVIGHDFGSPVAAWCALTRPDVFRSVVLMSAPFAGPPGAPAEIATPGQRELDENLASLTPPRKHYQHHYSRRGTEREMRDCPQGLGAFLRAYFHMKSADWSGNDPFRLGSWSAEEMAKMPRYYVMDRGAGMAKTVAPHMPSDEEATACRWLTDEELRFYSAEFSRTGFQGGLQWYRCTFTAEQTAELRAFSGETIDVPACFIAGEKDWGVYQQPGVLEYMQTSACTNMLGCELVPGAGHWVQQEQAGETVSRIKWFLSHTGAPLHVTE